MLDEASIATAWKSRRGNRGASVAMWDSIAADYHEKPLPTFEEDQLLGIVLRFGMIGPDSRVLDIACGAGGHSLALAPHVAHVTGTDISPKMLQHARERATRLRLDNVEFIAEDWRDHDPDAQGTRGAFDLVFAHMTSAVESAETFEKMSQVSRGWCVLSKPIRRDDPFSDGLRAVLGIESNRESGSADIFRGFALLWSQQRDPRIEYRDVEWLHKRPLETAREVYLNRMRTYRDLDDSDLALAEEYLASRVDADGRVGERTRLTIATLFWHV